VRKGSRYRLACRIVTDGEREGDLSRRGFERWDRVHVLFSCHFVLTVANVNKLLRAWGLWRWIHQTWMWMWRKGKLSGVWTTFVPMPLFSLRGLQCLFTSLPINNKSALAVSHGSLKQIYRNICSCSQHQIDRCPHHYQAGLWEMWSQLTILSLWQTSSQLFSFA
jgi:hypothetical protein